MSAGPKPDWAGLSPRAGSGMRSHCLTLGPGVLLRRTHCVSHTRSVDEASWARDLVSELGLLSLQHAIAETLLQKSVSHSLFIEAAPLNKNTRRRSSRSRLRGRMSRASASTCLPDAVPSPQPPAIHNFLKYNVTAWSRIKLRVRSSVGRRRVGEGAWE